MGLYRTIFPNIDKWRNPLIDRVRGFAALAVTFLHLRAFCPDSNLWPFNNAFFGALSKNGFHGVTMFFTISGFLITMISLKRWGKNGSLSGINIFEFYKMRFARIFPNLLLLIFILTTLHFFSISQFTVPAGKLLPAIWHALTFRYHYLLFENNQNGMFSWAPLWSLSIEELFYLCFPIVCLILKRKVSLIILFALIILAGPYLHEHYNLYSFRGSIDSLAFGCLFAILTFEKTISRKILFFFKISGISIVTVSYFTNFISENDKYSPTLFGMGMALLIVSSKDQTELTLLKKVFYPIDLLLRRIGTLSYEIYLFHVPIILLFNPIYSLFPNWMAPIIFLIWFLSLFLWSAIVNSLYSEPSNRWIRGIKINWVSNKIERIKLRYFKTEYFSKKIR